MNAMSRLEPPVIASAALWLDKRQDSIIGYITGTYTTHYVVDVNVWNASTKDVSDCVLELRVQQPDVVETKIGLRPDGKDVPTFSVPADTQLPMRFATYALVGNVYRLDKAFLRLQCLRPGYVIGTWEDIDLSGTNWYIN
ncbi:hypothetical protein SAMN05880593_12411 [Rhizobium sp. RU36D]|nr:hypothetical protein SAMN05880593_12411 [Rhizobium sp. RU36D]